MKNKGLFFSKLSSIATVCTVFALWISVYFSDQVEDALGFILILSVGILHGANDITLVKKVFKTKKDLSFFSILIRYVFVVIATGLSFFLIPGIALLVFVILSAYHFGEQHFASKIVKQNNLYNLLYAFYGLVIFGVLFYLNPSDTSEVIYNLTGFYPEKSFYKYILIVSLSLLFVIGIYGIIKKEISLKIGEELFLLILFVIIFKVASLIWAFSIYFIFWHSLPSLKDQIRLLYGKFDSRNVKKYVLSSIAYWILAIVGLGLVLYMFKEDQSLFLSLFFAFLAAITLPHVIVMHLALK